MNYPAFAASVLLLATGSFAAEPLVLEQSIPLDHVEGRIDHLAADPGRNRVYLAALENDSLEVVDLAEGKRVKFILHLSRPAGIRVIPGARHVLVACGGDGTARLFDADLRELAVIPKLDDADNIRLDPANRFAYVGYGDGALATIDLAARQKVADVKLPGHPESFQLARDGRIFVNVPSDHSLLVIDHDKVTARWPLKDVSSNFPMAVDDDNDRLLIACRFPAQVLALDVATGQVRSTADCVDDADDVFYDPPTKRLYVSGGAGAVTVLDCADMNHLKSIATIPTAPGARTSIFLPDKRLLCVAVPHRGKQRAELRVYRVSDGK